MESVVETYEPQHIERWTRPDHYAGEQFPEYFVFLGRHRDSDILSNSNFDCALRELGGESETVIIARAGHWAVGWVESILIHESDSKALQAADEMAAALSDYPVLDESDFSEREFEAVLEYWDGWRSSPDYQHRMWIIRDWNKRHEHWGAKFKPVPFLAARHSLHRLSELYPDLEQWIHETGRE
jgi:hypothetical protein